MPRLTAEVLLAHALRRERAYLYAHADEELSEVEWIHYGRYLHRALEGQADAVHHRTAGVLRPRIPRHAGRADSPARDRASGGSSACAAAAAPERIVLDVGTGSGAIAVTLALETGARCGRRDISSAALGVAAAERAHGWSARSTFVACDLVDGVRDGTYRSGGLESSLCSGQRCGEHASARSATMSRTSRCSAARRARDLPTADCRKPGGAEAGRMAGDGTWLQSVEAGARDARGGVGGSRSNPRSGGIPRVIARAMQRHEDLSSTSTWTRSSCRWRSSSIRRSKASRWWSAGRPNERGVVSAASYAARKFGVHSAMPLRTAYKLCPQAIFVDGHPRALPRIFEASLRSSAALFAAGGDGLDRRSVSRPDGHGTAARAAACRPRTGCTRQLSAATSLRTARIGIAASRLVAKIASDQAKPNGVLWILPGREARFLAPLDVRKIPGVGKVTEEHLHRSASGK